MGKLDPRQWDVEATTENKIMRVLTAAAPGAMTEDSISFAVAMMEDVCVSLAMVDFVVSGQAHAEFIGQDGEQHDSDKYQLRAI